MNLIYKINRFFMWNKLGTRLIALVLVFTTLISVISVNIANMEDTFASGPSGDVIFNQPYTPSIIEEGSALNLSQIIWTDKLVHSYYDSAYTAATSAQYNGFSTPDHGVIKENKLIFSGYAKEPLMDYYFSEEYDRISGFSFTLAPQSMIFHTFYQTGFLFNGTMRDGYYTGYAIVLECSNSEGMSEEGTAALKLYYIENEHFDTESFNPGNSTTTRTLITTLKDGIKNRTTPSFTISIGITSYGAVIVFLDGVQRVNIPANQVKGSVTGFGFFTGYYLHNCSILSVVRYDDLILGVFSDGEPAPAAASVEFVIENTNTQIRLPETETGLQGQEYIIKQPQEVEYDGDTYFLCGNSKGLPTYVDIDLKYSKNSDANKTSLYYRKRIVSTVSKTARVNGGEWNAGATDAPISAQMGAEIEYKIKASDAVGVPMLLTLPWGMLSPNSGFFGQTDIRRNAIVTVEFVNFPTVYSGNSSNAVNAFLSNYGGKWNGKNIVKAWDATEDNRIRHPSADPAELANPNLYYDTNKVIAWVTQSSESGKYDLFVGGFGGVWLSSRDMSASLFEYCASLKSVDFTNFYIDKATNIERITTASPITSITGLNNFDTSNMKRLDSVFWNASSGLTSYDVSTFDTSNVTDFTSMFANNAALTTIDIRHFDFSSLCNEDIYYGRALSGMFSGNPNLASINMSYAVIPPLTGDYVTLANMFGNCPNLNYLYLLNADFTQITDAQAQNMFNGSNDNMNIYVSSVEMKEWLENKKPSGANVYLMEPLTAPKPMPAPLPPRAVSKVCDVIPDGLTIIPESVTGGISHTINGQTITWDVTSFPAELSVKVRVTAESLEEMYVNGASVTYANGTTLETNNTYHKFDPFYSVNAQYYIYDGAQNDQQLVYDNSQTAYAPLVVAPGDDFDFFSSHAPSQLKGKFYYGYRYIDDVTDDMAVPQGDIHIGMPPAILFTNITSSKTIRYYYSDDSSVVMRNVTLHFVNSDGVEFASKKIETKISVGTDYSMPMTYLEHFSDSGKTHNYFAYELSNTVGTPKTPTTPDSSILLLSPQFENVQDNPHITLYFDSTPTLTINFVEYQNEFNMLKSSETYFINSDKTFTPPVGITDDINLVLDSELPITKLYKYVSYWSVDGGATLNTGNPPILSDIESNTTLTLYFRTDYKVTEKFHPKDPSGYSGTEAHWNDLQSSVETTVYSGDSFTGAPPLQITLSADTWNYIGYRVGNNDSATINSGYPSDPLIGSVNDNFTFIYVYEKPTEGDPTAQKSARVSTDGGASWSNWQASTAQSPVIVKLGDLIEYRIIVFGVSGTAALTVVDTLPAGLALADTANPSPSVGFSYTTVGTRTEVTWQGNYFERTFTVRAKVTAASGTFINTAVIDTPAKSGIITNPTYHRAGVIITEQFREMNNETAPIYPDRNFGAALGDTYTESPENLAAMGWKYAGWRIAGDMTVHLPSSPPDTIIGSVSESATIIYLYSPTSQHHVHIRQIVIDAQPWQETPKMGYFNLTNNGVKVPIMANSGIEGVYVSAFSNYLLMPQGDMKFSVQDIIPQYYEFAGYYKNVGSVADVQHNDSTQRVSAQTTENGNIVLDYSNENEYWITVYIKRKAAMSNYEWSYATNDFGQIN